MLAALAFDWSVNRAAGLTALLLSSLTIAAGILSSTGPGLGREVSRSVRGEGRSLHEALSWAALAAIAVHGAAFALDPFFDAGIVGAVVPFASPYRPLAVGAGQIAGYAMAALGLTYYLRHRLGPARWRKAHRWVAAFWALGVVHAFFSGTDAGRLWFQLAAVLPVVVAIVLLAVHWLQRLEDEPPPPGSPRETPAPPAPQVRPAGLLWSRDRA
jgi:hypothetical protein